MYPGFPISQKNTHDLDSNVGFSTTTVDYPEREGAGVSSCLVQSHEDSTPTVQESQDAVAHWDGDTSPRFHLAFSVLNLPRRYILKKSL